MIDSGDDMTNDHNESLADRLKRLGFEPLSAEEQARNLRQHVRSYQPEPCPECDKIECECCGACGGTGDDHSNPYKAQCGACDDTGRVKLENPEA